MPASGKPETDAAEPGEAALLVSEFPPPPFYYRHASQLTPPEIPTASLERASERAAAAAAKAKAESERLRLQLEDDDDKTNAILGGVTDENEEEGDIVAVFGEIVEDPLLVKVEDVCEDPTKIRDEVKRLNREVVGGFVQLVKSLVHKPLENKKQRDEMSHNVFLMLQECNKYREHQAREILIDLLEKEQQERIKIIENLRSQVVEADELLEKIQNL
jgi:mediator of RNA polymerase II transcription subunit 7